MQQKLENTDADYADDIAILANTPGQAETLLHSLERAAAGIGLHVNAHKTEYMCYNQTGDISTLDRTSMTLVDTEVPVVESLSSLSSTRVQILDETDCISHSTNTFGKGMNPIILPPAMGK